MQLIFSKAPLDEDLRATSAKEVLCNQWLDIKDSKWDKRFFCGDPEVLATYCALFLQYLCNSWTVWVYIYIKKKDSRQPSNILFFRFVPMYKLSGPTLNALKLHLNTNVRQPRWFLKEKMCNVRHRCQHRKSSLFRPDLVKSFFCVCLELIRMIGDLITRAMNACFLMLSVASIP